MGKLDIAKALVGKRSKVFQKVDPSNLKTKLKGRWYLDTFIEKAIFLTGFFALLYVVIIGISKLVGLFTG